MICRWSHTPRHTHTIRPTDHCWRQVFARIINSFTDCEGFRSDSCGQSEGTDSSRSDGTRQCSRPPNIGPSRICYRTWAWPKSYLAQVGVGPSSNEAWPKLQLAQVGRAHYLQVIHYLPLASYHCESITTLDLQLMTYK